MYRRSVTCVMNIRTKLDTNFDSICIKIGVFFVIVPKLAQLWQFGGEQVIRKADEKDINVIANMAALMWNDNCADELKKDFLDFFQKGKGQIFLKIEHDIPVGFAQCQLRYDYVEGTQTSPVGYLEGIFVKDACRKKGYAKELLAACEAWARESGCNEFASDCEIDNIDSLRFHLAVNFEEANRIICFTKKL